MPDIAGYAPGLFAFAFVAIMLGCALQRLSGQGYGLISAPIIAIIAPEMVPAALLLVGVVAGIGSAALDFKAIRISELPWGFAGRTIGAVLAAMVASALPFERIALLIALIVLVAVTLSLLGLTIPIRRATLFGAGIAAGLMGTLAAVGAPPMAMLYQREDPVRSRAMQSTFFLFGMAVSILALWWAGLVTMRHVTFAAWCLPAALIGIAISQPIARYMSAGMVRPMALIFSTAAALTLLWKVLLG